jgi:phosphoserine aminotransferase
MKYFTVGPTQEYPRLREFLSDALSKDIHSVSHRSPLFVDLFHATSESVRTLLRTPADRQVFFAGSATEWMERSIQNLSARNTLHFVSGHFAR